MSHPLYPVQQNHRLRGGSQATTSTSIQQRLLLGTLLGLPAPRVEPIDGFAPQKRGILR
jgi:hypothetical protein